MIVRKPFSLSLIAIAIAIAIPSLASATSLYHPAGGEVGATSHPDHVKSNISRGDVLGSVELARKDGTLSILSRGGAVPMKATAPSKTREQVQQEYLNMSVEEKQRLQELHGSGG